jgi:hypothetical protein
LIFTFTRGLLIEWIETLEDLQVLRQAAAELKAADGERRRAGWLEWEDDQIIDILTVRKRPPYDYKDLEQLLSGGD